MTSGYDTRIVRKSIAIRYDPVNHCSSIRNPEDRFLRVAAYIKSLLDFHFCVKESLWLKFFDRSEQISRIIPDAWDTVH